MAKLKTETNTDRMWRRVMSAATATFGRRNSFRINFEHEQFWLVDNKTGEMWSVVDAEGAGSIDGFAFEQC